MVVNRQSTKPRGYAFVEFDHERDMHGQFCTVFQSFTMFFYIFIGHKVGAFFVHFNV